MNMTCLQRWLGAWIAIAEHIVVIVTLGFVSPGWHVEWVLRCLGEKLPDEPDEEDLS